MAAAAGSRAETGPAAVARLRLQAARAVAISDVAPYFGTALSAMVMHEVAGLGTVATDTRWRFYYDPVVVAKWSLGECVAAWLHEVKHQLHRHAERFEAMGEPAQRHQVFNIAADALINEDLREMAAAVANHRLMKLGGDWVTLDGLPVPADRTMTAEEIYRLLIARDNEPPEGRDCGSGAGSAQLPRWWELPAQDATDGSVDTGRGELISRQTARDVASHIKARGIGSVPAGVRLWAERMLDPQVDWRTELRSVVSNRCAAIAGRRDYTYARPNRRRMPGRVVLPSMVAPAPPNGALVLDTSGSMTGEELAQGVAEVSGILKQVSRGRSTLQVIACDHSAAQAQAVRSAANVRLVGGGGTDMRIGMDAAAGLRPRVDFVVVFTDGETPWPDAPPPGNPGAKYIAVLSDGPRSGVPGWMHTIAVGRGDAALFDLQQALAAQSSN